MSARTRAWIALGSNLGDSHRILQQAWLRLGQETPISVLKLSHPYVTAPVGMESDHLFLNAVGILETDLEPEALLVQLQQVEHYFGRAQKTGADGYKDRLLDLDLLYYGDTVLASGDLILPHPHLASRLFVLAPLVEIDPEHLDPLTGMTAEAMYHQLQQRIERGKEDSQQIERNEWS
ncbi:MAG: 2-amino-4-hydroxy-6-hydroxymethyldihydropteridine diphosphokinase [Proteobacteria bacterium]|nr:2-amino-4-hydroxy-6-hydroxymethyldihydropteridine diphosphokinase [Pseudomonadota bacterium]MBU1231785.1 2-amino-4-hydroxy-6-hydroxymethyldihydropteridine diphosphokinase [Pseudomonadota bacterium]MBU1417826.1 2-amino-4-hydroxy-6-hydroxymethyldihydropteridine diphosphokinase [Pseudomonadota bacterium]MBU1456525.1 2-amino-4-hydroxy-6-hydroxymethyldihydropteridine diphosphokinase [Pseudomonadota bacterium]